MGGGSTVGYDNLKSSVVKTGDDTDNNDYVCNQIDLCIPPLIVINVHG